MQNHFSVQASSIDYLFTTSSVTLTLIKLTHLHLHSDLEQGVARRPSMGSPIRQSRLASSSPKCLFSYADMPETEERQGFSKGSDPIGCFLNPVHARQNAFRSRLYHRKMIRRAESPEVNDYEEYEECIEDSDLLVKQSIQKCIKIST